MPISATPRPSGSSGNAPAVTNGKALAATPPAFSLIDAVPRAIADPGTTAIWEQALDMVQSGEMPLEIFVAKQRARPYRQYLSGPKGATAALAYGEAEATLHLDVGFRVESDTSAKDKWRQRMVFPLATLVAGGVKPGDTLYMNITRVISPAVCGERPYQVDSWVSHSALHKVDRLAEVKLAP